MNELSQLKNYIITSNKYSFLLEGYMELFKKHWGSEVESVVLGFDKPDIELQENFSFHSMGNQDDGRGWCEPLIEFFESCTDDYFLMCFEDHYPIRPIKGEPRQRLIEGLGYLKEKRADKLYLMPDYHDRAASNLLTPLSMETGTSTKAFKRGFGERREEPSRIRNHLKPRQDGR